VIGHELTHGFDDQGRKIDAAGALRDWWTKEDATKFESALQKCWECSIPRSSRCPGVHVNGDLTMGENIAIWAASTLALDAYHASLGGKPAPVIDGLTVAISAFSSVGRRPGAAMGDRRLRAPAGGERSAFFRAQFRVIRRACATSTHGTTRSA